MKTKKIVILGAESSGKTALSEYLKFILKAHVIGERVRELHHNSDLTFAEIEQLARCMETDEKAILIQNPTFTIFDTDFINFQVWFEWSYNDCPLWILEKISQYDIDLFIITENDLQWQPDNFRALPNKSDRDILRQNYLEIIRSINIPYFEISGKDEARNLCALKIINDFYKDEIIHTS